MVPRSSFLICANLRTGSNLLATTIRHTSVAGYPHEYFSPALLTSPDMTRLLELTPEEIRSRRLAGRLRHILTKGTTPNGIFAATTHWPHLPPLLAAIGEAQGSDISLDNGALEGLRSFFPDLRFVRLHRGNHIAQAISNYIARATNRWSERAQDPVTDPLVEDGLEYDFAAIQQFVTLAQKADEGWERLLSPCRDLTLSISYEDLVADRVATVGRLLAFVGAPPVEIPVEKMSLRRQATARSVEWEARFRAEAAETPRKISRRRPEVSVQPSTESVATERSVLICASPRTGSNFLATTLRGTGVVGRSREYFCPAMLNAPSMLTSIGLSKDEPNPPDLANRLDLILAAGTGKNGVFGATVHWGHMAGLTAAIATRRGENPAVATPSVTALQSVFPHLRIIWLRRENVVAQGISHFMAKKTGVWFHGQRADLAAVEAKPPYDFATIDRLVRHARREEENWRRFLAQSEDLALSITYETLIADFETVIGRVMTFLDLPLANGLPPRPLGRQAGGYSLELEERYRRDAAAIPPQQKKLAGGRAAF